MSTETFVSEPIKPVTSTADANAMAAGGPGMPSEFTWRGEQLRVVSIVRTWKETGRCQHSRTESYVRKHWFEVETSAGQRATIYFERRVRGRDLKRRWWLYTIDAEGSSG